MVFFAEKLIFYLLIVLLIETSYQQSYNKLCGSTRLSANEIIHRAFIAKILNKTSIETEWTYEEELNNFCKINGFFENNFFESIKVTNLHSNQIQNKNVIVTVSNKISKLFVDNLNKTSFKYWLKFKLPEEGFYCTMCRTFLTFNVVYNENKKKDVNITYGLIKNLYSSIIDLDRFQSIIHEDKSHFLNESFILKPFNEISSFHNNTKINKYTFYLNLSLFLQPDQYLLVGVNSDDNDKLLDVNGNHAKTQEILQQDLNKFYLEYSLCYNFDLKSNKFLPVINCFPIFSENYLNLIENKEMINNADCVCWISNTYKILIILNKIGQTNGIKYNFTNSMQIITNRIDCKLGSNSKQILYQVMAQINLPSTNKANLPGNLKIKMYSNQNQIINEVTFNSNSYFFRSFLFTDDILQSNIFLRSNTLLDRVHNISLEFETIVPECNNLYLYGVIITSGLKKVHYIFPYSNYLTHGVEVRLSELKSWNIYISRQYSHIIQLRDILPIQFPKYIRLSRIEKLLFVLFYLSKFANNSLNFIQNEYISWPYLFILNIIYNYIIFSITLILYLVLIKPFLLMDYYLIRLENEFIEFKCFIFIFLFFPLNILLSTIKEIQTNVWHNNITIYNLFNFNHLVIYNDFKWTILFLSELSIFYFLLKLFEIIFYKYQKDKKIIGGPTNAIEDRIINLN